MVNTGLLVVGGLVIAGGLYLYSQQPETNEVGGGQGNFTDTGTEQPIINLSFSDLFGNEPTSSGGGGSNDTSTPTTTPSSSGSKKITQVVNQDGVKIFSDSQTGKLLGSEDPNRLASFNAEGTQKNLGLSAVSSQMNYSPATSNTKKAQATITQNLIGASSSSTPSSSSKASNTPIDTKKTKKLDITGQLVRG
jgi:hypothetical protein